MIPHVTALYAAPLALLVTALSIHVTMLRAKTKISLLDGGNHQLTERIRRHGNFVENVPMVLLLMLLNHSRRAARLAKNGAFVPLEYHDRKMWDRAQANKGIALLESALARGRPGIYQLQAAISAVHAEAASHEGTRWREIALLYERLHALSPNPVFLLNRAVALSFPGNPKAGLDAILELQESSWRLPAFSCGACGFSAKAGADHRGAQRL